MINNSQTKKVKRIVCTTPLAHKVVGHRWPCMNQLVMHFLIHNIAQKNLETRTSSFFERREQYYISCLGVNVVLYCSIWKEQFVTASCGSISQTCQPKLNDKENFAILSASYFLRRDSCTSKQDWNSFLLAITFLTTYA